MANNKRHDTLINKKKEFNWVNNDMRLVRRQRRIEITRFTSSKLCNQSYSMLEKEINKLSTEELNYKIGKMKQKSREKNYKIIRRQLDVIIRVAWNALSK